MNIAVFADIHGRILLSFKLCARWEQETGQKIDLILQAGDLGVFPDFQRLDKATRRYAEQDPTELGFLQHFVTYDKKVAAELQKTTCSLIFVRGNHEDHQWLDELEQQTPESTPIFSIDAYQRIWCLKSGVPYTFTTGQEVITILGIGRIGAKDGETNDQQPKYVQPYERERLNKRLSNDVYDILLTHDSPYGAIYSNSGIKELDTLIELYQPRYHFFGHYGGPSLVQTYTNSDIPCIAYKLADLRWDRTDTGARLEAGSMGLLSWQDRETSQFSLIDDPWLREYSAFSWQYL